MKTLKNPEVKHEMIAYILLLALFSVAEWISGHFYSILPLVILGCCYMLLHLFFAYKRYRYISKLNQSIDRILHGQEQLLIADNSEGELSILRSEIQKMTIRLRESTDCLKHDKIQLTNAIADISHQLRTPLTSMNLTVSMLTTEELSYERRIELTHTLKKSLRKIDWLIESLLKISKLDAGTAKFVSEPISVAELIKKSADPLRIPMELREQTLKVQVHEEKYSGDLYWSIEALSNILKNCMEHTPSGGAIEIKVSETTLFTEIIVKDDGEGFDPHDIPHLFERFYKGKNASSESVGIGLALARMVISTQNGTVQASNSPGGGALFTIRFYKGIL